MIRWRGSRSAHTPPNSSSATSGSVCAASTSPRSVGEPVRCVMNSASATTTTRSPTTLAAWPRNRYRKSAVAQNAQVRTHQTHSTERDNRAGRRRERAPPAACSETAGVRREVTVETLSIAPISVPPTQLQPPRIAAWPPRSRPASTPRSSACRSSGSARATTPTRTSSTRRSCSRPRTATRASSCRSSRSTTRCSAGSTRRSRS